MKSCVWGMLQVTVVGTGLCVLAWFGFGFLISKIDVGSERRSDCANNLRQLGLAHHQYAGDSRKALPDSLLAIGPYAAGQTSLLVCPEDVSEAVVKATHWSELTAANISYTFVAGGSLGSREPDQVLMFCDPGAHENDGANIPKRSCHHKAHATQRDRPYRGC